MQSSYRIIKGALEDETQSKKVIPIITIESHKNTREIHSREKGIPLKSFSDSPRDQADRIIQEALEEAEKIKKEALAKSQEQAKVILEELKESTYTKAYKEGFEKATSEGYKEGLDKANQECLLIRKQAKMVLENAHIKSEEIIERTHSDIINLAIDIAKNVVNRMKLEDDKLLIDMARNAFAELKGKDQIIINIHPSNKDLFVAHLEELKEMCPNCHFILLEDAAMDSVGCRLESDTAIIDTQVGKQLKKMKEALLEMRTGNEV